MTKHGRNLVFCIMRAAPLSEGSIDEKCVCTHIRGRTRVIKLVRARITDPQSGETTTLRMQNWPYYVHLLLFTHMYIRSQLSSFTWSPFPLQQWGCMDDRWNDFVVILFVLPDLPRFHENMRKPSWIIVLKDTGYSKKKLRHHTEGSPEWEHAVRRRVL